MSLHCFVQNKNRKKEKDTKIDSSKAAAVKILMKCERFNTLGLVVAVSLFFFPK